MDGVDPAAHIPVLKNEVVRYLLGPRDGTYVDATFGRGGHCRALLDRLDASARMIVLDRDPEAIAVARELAAQDARLSVLHCRYAQLRNALEELGIASVDGVLMDVGVSSPQLDNAQRGFSFAHDGPLDMRMDPTTGTSAADWLNAADVGEIARVIKQLGEERHAWRIARAIHAARPLTTTTELAEVVANAVPRSGQRRHPATKTFQAIRIMINAEDAELESGIEAAFDALHAGGRLAVISFHSLEDRHVKNVFRALSRPPELPRRLPVRAQAHAVRGTLIAGPVRASAAEVAANPRSRSATLRVIEKAGAAG